MIDKRIVTCFLESDERILLLKRSQQVSTYQNRWAGISGYLEVSRTPYQQALVEIKEEAGLTEAELELIGSGNSIEIADKDLDIKWLVHPFRFRIKNTDRIKTDREHQEVKWIKPSEIDGYQTVPGLRQAWEAVL